MKEKLSGMQWKLTMQIKYFAERRIFIGQLCNKFAIAFTNTKEKEKNRFEIIACSLRIIKVKVGQHTCNV